jgi:hypothetical protein
LLFVGAVQPHQYPGDRHLPIIHHFEAEAKQPKKIISDNEDLLIEYADNVKSINNKYAVSARDK